MCSSFVPRRRLTYGESSDLLEDVGEELLEEFERDFLARNRRQVLAEIGDLVVVDFHGESEDGSARRVLISKQAPWLAQSEASVAPDGSVDLNRVPQRVQQALIASLALVAPREAASSRSSIAQIGAGACVAATALSLRLPDARVEAWDLDERALRLAADHFGAERGACVRLVRDAEEIVGESEIGSRAAILLDVCGVGGGRGEAGRSPRPTPSSSRASSRGPWRPSSLEACSPSTWPTRTRRKRSRPSRASRGPGAWPSDRSSCGGRGESAAILGWCTHARPTGPRLLRKLRSSLRMARCADCARKSRSCCSPRRTPFGK